MYVDDATLGAADDDEGTCAQIACQAAEDCLGAVEAELGGSIALDKADAVGSSAAVVATARRRLKAYAGRRASTVVSLGVDLVAGQRRTLWCVR